LGRIRTIKPEFWEDDRVGQLSPLARLVFIGSWNLADDAGRLRWSADYINASLFMYDRLTTKKVAALMAEVEAQELVTPYEARGQRLAFIPGWHHQRIDKPQPARFPPPDGQHSQNDSGNGSGNEDGNAPRQEGKGREGKGREQGMSPDGDPAFEAFWLTYPPRDGKRIGKAKAAERWAKLSDDDRQAASIGAGHLAAAIAAGGKFGPPDAERWLRDRKWADWQEPASVSTNGANGHARPSPHDAAAEAARALMERNALPPCRACDSTGWCDTDAGVAPCGACERVSA
jgi:hypothetical protein